MRLRLTLRGLLRAPAFSLASIGTIALAVCLSTTVFAVVDGVLFKPLPYPDAGELMVVGGGPEGLDEGTLSHRDREYLRRASPDVLVTAYGGWWHFTHPAGGLRELRGAHVDRRFFDVLGVRPLVGGFDDADFKQPYVEGAVRPVIVAFEFWRDYLDGEAQQLGHTFEMRGGRFRLAGILPPGFVFPAERRSRLEFLFAMPDWWSQDRDRWDRSHSTLARVARADLPRVHQAWNAAMASTTHDYGPPTRASGEQPYDRVSFTRLSQVLGARERPFFLVAFAGAAWIVLLACVNVASLALARARARARELRVCVTLGAGRTQIAALILREILIVTVAGAALGLVCAQPLLWIVHDQLPSDVNLLRPLAVDWRVALFAFSAPLASMLALSSIPLRCAFRDAPAGASATTTTPRARSWGASALLAIESGLGVAVLIIGSLVMASFFLLRSEPSGFAGDRLILAQIRIAVSQQDTAQRAAVQDDLLRRMAATPGIDKAAVVGGTLFENTYSALILEPPAHTPALQVVQIPVSEQFFEIAGLTLEEGRLPTAAELRRGDPVAVLSRPAVRDLWADGPALGRVVRGRWDPNVYTVIGVVSDVRTFAQYEGNVGEAFTPLERSEHGRMFARYVLRATGDPRAASAAVRRTLERDVPGIVVDRVEPFGNALAGTVRLQRFQAALFATAAGAAVLLLAVGVAGIAASSVRRRWREVGIRSALGATGNRIVRLLVKDHVRPCATGITAGLLASWWAKALLAQLLYELHPGDPRVWAAASVLIVLVVIIAAWLPARRAAHADPALVLRAE